MKLRWISILAVPMLFAAPAIGAEAATDGSLQMDRHTTELTVRLLLEELQRQWSSRPVTAAELLAWQQPRLAELTDPAAGEKVVAALYAGHLRNTYAERVRALWQELQSGHGDPAVLTDAARSEAEQLPDAVIAANVKNVFPAPYREARESLVAGQRGQLTEVVYPTVREIESSDDKTLIPQLRARLVAASNQPILAENLAFLETDRIQPVLEDARRQRTMQLKWIRNVDLTQVYDPEQARSLMHEAALAQLAAQRQAEPNRHWYDLFPGVDDAIDKRCGTLFWDKVRAALPAHTPVITEDQLATRMLAEPEKFKDAAAAEKTLRFEYMDNAVAAAVRQVMDAAPADHPGVNKWAEGGWKSLPKDIDKTLSDAFAVNVAPRLPAARKLAAERQFIALFPDLAAGSWIVPMTAVEARKTPERDFTVYCESKTPAIDLALCLPETVELATAAGHRQFEIGLQALSRQRQSVDEVYGRLEQELQAVQARSNAADGVTLLAGDGNTGIDLTRLPLPAELTATYTKRVLGEWSKTGSTYPDLFPAVREEIAVRVKALLAALRPDELPKPPPTPVKDEVPIDFVITLSRPGESIQVDLSQGGSSLTERLNCPVQPGSYRQHEEEVLKATSRWITERVLAAQAQAGDAPLKLNIQIQVKDGWIYYQFVSRMLTELRSALQKHKLKLEDLLM